MHCLRCKASCKSKNMIYIKKNKSQGSEVLAVCDENLIGKVFRDKKMKLEITERFYKGDLVDEEKAVKFMKEAKSINIAGKNSINLAIKSGMIDKGNVIKIKKIPHALIFEI